MLWATQVNLVYSEDIVKRKYKSIFGAPLGRKDGNEYHQASVVGRKCPLIEQNYDMTAEAIDDPTR